MWDGRLFSRSRNGALLVMEARSIGDRADALTTLLVTCDGTSCL